VRERDGEAHTFRVTLIRPTPGFTSANPAGAGGKG
jgi:hypothetical protein